MSNVLGILEERGFVYQTTDDSPARNHLRELLGGDRVSAYIGFDHHVAGSVIVRRGHDCD